FEIRDELATRLLARADHHRVDVENLRLAVEDDVQARVVDLHVLDAGEHRHTAPAQQRAADPAGGFREPFADFGALALQEPELARRRIFPRRLQPAATFVI